MSNNQADANIISDSISMSSLYVNTKSVYYDTNMSRAYNIVVKRVLRVTVRLLRASSEAEGEVAEKGKICCF